MRSLFLLTVCFLVRCAFAVATTNQVVMVDQRGNLNTEAVATVQNVASNAAAVQVAAAKAEAAEQVAQETSAAMSAIVQNIMENNVVIYRRGFSDGFAALVVISENDKLVISDYQLLSVSSTQIVSRISYVMTTDLGTTKPTVMARNTLSQRTDFEELASANVTTPVYHAGAVTVGGETYSGYYTIEATVTNPDSSAHYFYWIKIDVDAALGDGATLDLANGVTGGVSTTVTWGDKTLTFTGGVLTGVE